MRARPHAVVLALLLVVGVLVVDPAGWSPFGPARWAAVLVVVGAGGALALRRPFSMARRPALMWLAFLSWVAISAARGLDHLYAWIGTPQRHFGALTWGLCALVFVLGQTLDDDGDARVVVGTAAAVCGAAGAWAVAEELGWQPVVLAGNDRLVGSLGNADYLGAAMALLVPIAAGVAADRSWGRRLRAGAGLSAALGVTALIGSGARGAWLGVAVATAVACWVWREPLARRRRAAVPASLGVAGAAVGLAYATGVASRVPAAFEDRGPGGASRLAEWRVAARVIADHPVTGTGPEGYRIAFGTAVNRSYQVTYGRATLPDRAHDVILDVAATLGLPGAVLYLVLVALVAAAAWRLVRGGSPPWLTGVVLGLAAYGVGELLLFPIAELEPGVWLLAGVVTARATERQRSVTVRLPRPVGVVAVGLAGLALAFGVRDVHADRMTRAALDAAARGDLPRARSDAAIAVADDPDNITVLLAAAQVDGEGGTEADLRAALADDDAALQVSPADPVAGDARAQLLVTRAQASEVPAAWTAAGADLTGLLRRDPLNPALLLDQGVVDAATGRERAATLAWQSAAGLAPASAAPWVDLAVMELGAGKGGTAGHDARAALARDPGNERAQAVLSRLEIHRTDTGNVSDQ